ncbi:VWA domain-containing protein [Aliikangiella sp. IMCC44653]
MMLDIINNFHFTRPEWLGLIVPIIILFLLLRSQNQKQSAWHQVISPHLLKFLLQSSQSTKVRSGILLAFSIALLSIIAISGPSFREKSVPVFESDNAQVILLDLSLSMDATDIKPSRLERAKFKLMDLLATTNEGTIGLVVYAGDAFVISPLTSDAKTVANMVPTLSTSIMPVLGSRPDLGVAKAIDLLKNAKHKNGQIIWLTDGVEFQHTSAITDIINSSGYELSILAIGTAQGAPIPLPNKNGFLKDSNGAIVVPKLQIQPLSNIADKTNAGIVELTADSYDLDYLKQRFQMSLDAQINSEQSEQKISRWIDDGYWLVVIVMALLFIHLLRFSSQTILRSVGATIIAFGVTSYPDKSLHALEWKDLWLTQQQQANQAFQQGEYDRAAQLFEDNNWKGAALYQNGNYQQAAELFAGESSQAPSKENEKPNKLTNNPIGVPAESDDASNKTINPAPLPQYDSNLQQYNHATALAKANQLEAALSVYNDLLNKQPKHEDALHNKKIIEELLKKQQQEQQNQNDQQDQQQNQDQQDQQEQQDQQNQQDKQQSEQEKQQSEQEQQQSEQEKQQQQKEMELTEDQRDKSEKDQALEHWLEKIPDDPGGLLRRKMYREYQRRGREQKEEKLW